MKGAFLLAVAGAERPQAINCCSVKQDAAIIYPRYRCRGQRAVAAAFWNTSLAGLHQQNYCQLRIRPDHIWGRCENKFLEQEGVVAQPREMANFSVPLYSKTSPEIIRLAVMLYVRYPRTASIVQ